MNGQSPSGLEDINARLFAPTTRGTKVYPLAIRPGVCVRVNLDGITVTKAGQWRVTAERVRKGQSEEAQAVYQSCLCLAETITEILIDGVTQTAPDLDGAPLSFRSRQFIAQLTPGLIAPSSAEAVIAFMSENGAFTIATNASTDAGIELGTGLALDEDPTKASSMT